MIPRVNKALAHHTRASSESLTYKMDTQKEIIRDMVEGLNSVKQAVYKILSTERYMYYIYSPNYGIELNDLIGAPVSYVCPELERRITEALIIDDRITGVDSFSFSMPSKGIVCVSFTVRSVFGDFQDHKEVRY